MVAACVVNHEDDTHLCLVAGKRLGGWRDGFAFARWAGIGRAHGEDVKAWKEGEGALVLSLGV